MQYNSFWGLLLVVSSTMASMILINWIVYEGLKPDYLILSFAVVTSFIAGVRMLIIIK